MMTVGSSAIPSYVWGIDKEGAYLYSGETISAIIASVIITFSKKIFLASLNHFYVIDSSSQLVNHLGRFLLSGEWSIKQNQGMKGHVVINIIIMTHWITLVSQ